MYSHPRESSPANTCLFYWVEQKTQTEKSKSAYNLKVSHNVFISAKENKTCSVLKQQFFENPSLISAVPHCKYKKGVYSDTPFLSSDMFCSAEDEGFKPPIPRKWYTGFRVQRIRSLCQSSLFAYAKLIIIFRMCKIIYMIYYDCYGQLYKGCSVYELVYVYK